MSYTLNYVANPVLEKQLLKLDKFSKELEVDMFFDNDPLDELKAMDLDQVFELVKDSYFFYKEEENWRPEVAKIKAIEEYTLWFYGDKERETSLRKLVNEL
jgi:hypothetical protein